MLTVSPEHPVGHINQWPPGDAVTWQRLVTHAERAVDLFGLTPIEAYHDAALALGLDGDEYHWLVDDALAHVRGLFFFLDGDCYLFAQSWLAVAARRDLARWWLVEEAKRLAKTSDQ